MYQINYKASHDNKTFGDNRFIITHDLDSSLEYINSGKDFISSDVRVIENAFGSLAEANTEIDRLRKLLSNSYVELQQLKKGYNEFISREREDEN